MVIDCHGHYTTVPREVQAFRDAQIAGLSSATAQLQAAIAISDDRIRESVQPQIAFQAARGTDLTIFSPRASAMGHHAGDGAANRRWAQVFGLAFPCRGFTSTFCRQLAARFGT